jgi:hypothetical protein
VHLLYALIRVELRRRHAARSTQDPRRGSMSARNKRMQSEINQSPSNPLNILVARCELRTAAIRDIRDASRKSSKYPQKRLARVVFISLGDFDRHALVALCRCAAFVIFDLLPFGRWTLWPLSSLTPA